MNVIRGVHAKAASGRYFPLSFREVRDVLMGQPALSADDALNVEYRNNTECPPHGALLLEYERGFALTIFSVVHDTPVRPAAAALVDALTALPTFPVLATSPYHRGRRQLYRAYLGMHGVPVLTELARVYAVGRYRGNDRLATSRKARLVSETERRIPAWPA